MGGGGGGWRGERGRGTEEVIFFTKNPNVNKTKKIRGVGVGERELE